MQNENLNDLDSAAIDEIIDLEAYAKAGKNPPRAKKYIIKVDGERYTVDVSSMTGKEILLRAGKTPPDRYKLRQKVHGQFKTIALDERIDFTTPGIERFTTIDNTHTEGCC